MQRLWVGVTLGGLLVVAAVVVLVGIPVGYFLFAYGCGEQEDRLAEVMAGDPVLDRWPAGAGKGEPFKGCDDDDRFVYVGNDYPYSASWQSALIHYRESAEANGWRPWSAEPGADPVSECFTKSVGGTTAYLTLESPAKGTLQVHITADHAGSEWC